MKYLSLALFILPSMVFAASKINCDTIERFNDQRIEKSFSTEIENNVAFKQVASKEDSNIVFVVYYSKANDLFGVRVNDQNYGTSSGNFVEPSHEKSLVKVRYIKNMPEPQLFAIDCTLDN